MKVLDHPHRLEMQAESRGWYEFTGLVRTLTLAERLQPGYYRDPDWSVRDLVAHLGTWQAEADVQFERMRAGTYAGHDVDVDALNAAMLEAMHDQPWEVVWIQANAARTKMLEDWSSMREDSAETAWWIHKAAAPHYDDHLPRLRQWVRELRAQREAPDSSP